MMERNRTDFVESRRQIGRWWWVLVLGSIAVLSFLTGCRKHPKMGVFRVYVQALSPEGVGLAKAQVTFNKKSVGLTDPAGDFLGHYKGRINSFVEIRVALANGSFFKIRRKLRIRRSGKRWQTVDVRVQAVLSRSPVMTVGPSDSGPNGKPVMTVRMKPTRPAVVAKAVPQLRPIPVPGMAQSAPDEARKAKQRRELERKRKREQQLQEQKLKAQRRKEVQEKKVRGRERKEAHSPPKEREDREQKLIEELQREQADRMRKSKQKKVAVAAPTSRDPAVVVIPIRRRPPPRRRTKELENLLGVGTPEPRRVAPRVPAPQSPTNRGGAIQPRCLQRVRGIRRIVNVRTTVGATLYLKGNCNERLGRVSSSGRMRLALPQRTFQRIQVVFASGVSKNKVIEVGSGRSPLNVSAQLGGKSCNLTRIQKKLRNNIRPEQEEVTCLKAVKPNNPQYFSALLYLGRYYCRQRSYSAGQSLLAKLARNPRNRFLPYRALKLGIQLAGCRKYRDALRFLKQAERMKMRFAAADRYRNTKSIYKAMMDISERRYFASKSSNDLMRAVKSCQRLLEVTRSSDRTKSATQASCTRLQRLAKSRGIGQN